MTTFLEIKFRGGLGNQLFQYAAARKICADKKIPFLLFNVSEYNDESLGRKFSLINYRVRGKILGSGLGKKIFGHGTKLNRFMNSLALHKHINESGFVLHNLTGKMCLFTSLNGYWQSDLYFKTIRKQLTEELQPLTHPVFPAWLSHTDTVAIHIRRTDYLQESRYGFLGKNYYTDAINYVKQRVTNPVFVIFSDDMKWCREHFMEKEIIFSEDEEWERDYLQLFLMSKCKHQIIANSSFSWWGAWLNTNAEKIVIRPQTPFFDASLLYESHYPEEWIVIRN